MKDLIRFFQLAPEKIAELVFILEGEDGVAVVRTLDPDRGIIEMLIAPALEPDLNLILQGLGPEFGIREIPKPRDLVSIADEQDRQP